MKLSFHGADRDVTGSCHLIECNGHRILIDCGFFQGGRELELENAKPLGFDAGSIDHLLLTHAHLDHCGRLPLLAKRGFRGEILSTAATRELAKLVLLDAAHLQEEEANARARRAARRGADHPQTEPLYSLLDTLNCLDYFGRNAAYDEPFDIAPGVRATFIDAGHILGSASIFLEIEERGKRLSVLFSGDLGNAERPLLRPPATPPHADLVVMETTYGDRLHKSFGSSVEELYGAITGAFERGGNVVIPTYALERAQELLFILHEGVAQGRLPKAMQVFLDSPMAISATDIFRHHPECLEAHTARLFSGGGDPFQLPGLHMTRQTADSIALNDIKGGAVIMAGSGMCTGGRIVHHLKHNLSRAASSVVFVGYAAAGTLARQIIDGASMVRIFDEDIAVRAHIATINGFSAHADQGELLAWHGHTGAGRTFLVHGERSTMEQFATKLAGTKVEMPALDQGFDV